MIADEYYASLAAVRALRAGGYAPVVGTTTPDGYARRSRAAVARAALPSPEQGDAFLDAVAALVRDSGAQVVLPGTEASVLALAGRDDVVAPAVLGAPPPDVLRRLADKNALGDVAGRAGLATPAALVVADGDGDKIPDDVELPAVLKPARSAEQTDDGTIDLPRAVRVETVDELRRGVAERPELTWLIQPFLRGRLLAVAGVSDGGATRCTVHQAARRIYPIDCGVSAFAETIECNDELDARVRRLLHLIGLTGIWEMQFIEHSGEPLLIDFNPRMYGSLALAVAAGANLPALHVDILLGERPAPCSYRVGVRFRSEMRELGVVADALRTRDARTLRDVFTPKRRTTHAVLSLRDPAPALLLAHRIATRARG